MTFLPGFNPVSIAVLLLGISGHLSQEEWDRQIFMACLYVTAIVIVFLVAGHFVVLAFGISIPGIRIVGGMIIGSLGFRMMFPDEGESVGEGKEEAQAKLDLSFSPPAMPSLSGRGSIAAVITVSSSMDGRHGPTRSSPVPASCGRPSSRREVVAGTPGSFAPLPGRE